MSSILRSLISSFSAVDPIVPVLTSVFTPVAGSSASTLYVPAKSRSSLKVSVNVTSVASLGTYCLTSYLKVSFAFSSTACTSSSTRFSGVGGGVTSTSFVTFDLLSMVTVAVFGILVVGSPFSSLYKERRYSSVMPSLICALNSTRSFLLPASAAALSLISIISLPVFLFCVTLTVSSASVRAVSAPSLSISLMTTSLPPTNSSTFSMISSTLMFLERAGISCSITYVYSSRLSASLS